MLYFFVERGYNSLVHQPGSTIRDKKTRLDYVVQSVTAGAVAGSLVLFALGVYDRKMIRAEANTLEELERQFLRVATPRTPSSPEDVLNAHQNIARRFAASDEELFQKILTDPRYEDLRDLLLMAGHAENQQGVAEGLTDLARLITAPYKKRVDRDTVHAALTRFMEGTDFEPEFIADLADRIAHQTRFLAKGHLDSDQKEAIVDMFTRGNRGWTGAHYGMRYRLWAATEDMGPAKLEQQLFFPIILDEKNAFKQKILRPYRSHGLGRTGIAEEEVVTSFGYAVTKVTGSEAPAALLEIAKRTAKKSSDTIKGGRLNRLLLSVYNEMDPDVRAAVTTLGLVRAFSAGVAKKPFQFLKEAGVYSRGTQVARPETVGSIRRNLDVRKIIEGVVGTDSEVLKQTVVAVDFRTFTRQHLKSFPQLKLSGFRGRNLNASNLDLLAEFQSRLKTPYVLMTAEQARKWTMGMTRSLDLDQVIENHRTLHEKVVKATQGAAYDPDTNLTKVLQLNIASKFGGMGKGGRFEFGTEQLVYVTGTHSQDIIGQLELERAIPKQRIRLPAVQEPPEGHTRLYFNDLSVFKQSEDNKFPHVDAENNVILTGNSHKISTDIRDLKEGPDIIRYIDVPTEHIQFMEIPEEEIHSAALEGRAIPYERKRTLPPRLRRTRKKYRRVVFAESIDPGKAKPVIEGTDIEDPNFLPKLQVFKRRKTLPDGTEVEVHLGSTHQGLQEMFSRLKKISGIPTEQHPDWGSLSFASGAGALRQAPADWQSLAKLQNVAIAKVVENEKKRTMFIHSNIETSIYDQLELIKKFLTKGGTIVDIETSRPTAENPIGELLQLSFAKVKKVPNRDINRPDAMRWEVITLNRQEVDENGRLRVIDFENDAERAQAIIEFTRHVRNSRSPVGSQYDFDIPRLIDYAEKIAREGNVSEDVKRELLSAKRTLQNVYDKRYFDIRTIFQLAGETNLKQDYLTRKYLGKGELHQAAEDVSDALELIFKPSDRARFGGGAPDGTTTAASRARNVLFEEVPGLKVLSPAEAERMVGFENGPMAGPILIGNRRFDPMFGRVFRVRAIQHAVEPVAPGMDPKESKVVKAIIQVYKVQLDELNQGVGVAPTEQFKEITATNMAMLMAMLQKGTETLEDGQLRAEHVELFKQAIDDKGDRLLRALNPWTKSYADPTGSFKTEMMGHISGVWYLADREAARLYNRGWSDRFIRLAERSGRQAPEVLQEALVRRFRRQGAEGEHADLMAELISRRLYEMHTDPVTASAMTDRSLSDYARLLHSPEDPTENPVGETLERLIRRSLTGSERGSLGAIGRGGGYTHKYAYIAYLSNMAEKRANVAVEEGLPSFSINLGQRYQHFGTGDLMKDENLLGISEKVRTVVHNVMIEDLVDKPDSPATDLVRQAAERIAERRGADPAEILRNVKAQMTEAATELRNNLGTWEITASHIENITADRRYRDLAELSDEIMKSRDLAERVVSSVRDRFGPEGTYNNAIPQEQQAQHQRLVDLLNNALSEVDARRASGDHRADYMAALQKVFEDERDLVRSSLKPRFERLSRRAFTGDTHNDLLNAIAEAERVFGRMNPETGRFEGGLISRIAGHDAASSLAYAAWEQFYSEVGEAIGSQPYGSIERTKIPAQVMRRIFSEENLRNIYEEKFSVGREELSAFMNDLRRGTARGPGAPAEDAPSILPRIHELFIREGADTSKFYEAAKKVRAPLMAIGGMIALMAAKEPKDDAFHQGHVSRTTPGAIARYSEIPGNSAIQASWSGDPYPFQIDITFSGLVANKREQEQLMKHVYSAVSGGLRVTRVNTNVQDERAKSHTIAARELGDYF